MLTGCCGPGGPLSARARATATSAPRAAEPRAEGPRLTDPQTRRTLREAGIDPDQLPCNSDVRWGGNLRRYSEEAAEEVARRWGVKITDPARRRAGARAILGYLVRTIFDETRPDNLGVMRLRGRHYRDARGRRRPLLVFRSGVLFDAGQPGSCATALLARADVRHVINLYAGHFPLHDLIAAERAMASKLGATHHDERRAAKRWRELIKHPEGYSKHLALATRRVARLIREQILRPRGAAPRGNIHFHCGGGMHRSGMIFGILQRCINGEPMASIERRYRRHVGYVGDDKPSGYEPLNLRFVRDFDCGLLEEAPAK